MTFKIVFKSQSRSSRNKTDVCEPNFNVPCYPRYDMTEYETKYTHPSKTLIKEESKPQETFFNTTQKITLKSLTLISEIPRPRQSASLVNNLLPKLIFWNIVWIIFRWKDENTTAWNGYSTIVPTWKEHKYIDPSILLKYV